jgi:di/tricarboxylate transporter
MLPSIAASAAAARAIGYAGLGDLIEAEQLNPARIAFIFQFSASKRAARDCSLLLLAGAFGRYRARPHGWDGEEERRLCLEALADEPDPKAALAKAPAKAAIIIGGLLLLSRRVKSRRVYKEIDWSLLLMFAGLFIIVAGAEHSLLTPEIIARVGRLHLDQVPVLSAVTAVLP